MLGAVKILRKNGGVASAKLGNCRKKGTQVSSLCRFLFNNNMVNYLYVFMLIHRRQMKNDGAELNSLNLEQPFTWIFSTFDLFDE